MRRFGVYNRTLMPRGGHTASENGTVPDPAENTPQETLNPQEPESQIPERDSYGLAAIKRVLERHDSISRRL